MGLWDILKTGANFIPGVGPLISEGMGMLGGGGNKGSNPWDSGSYGGGGGNGGGGFGGGLGGVWDWAKSNPQYSIPLGMAAASGIGGIGKGRREADYMRANTRGSELQNALLEMSLGRQKQFQPAYDQAAKMAPEILQGRGPVQNYLGGLKDRSMTFGPNIQDKLRMYLEG